MDGGELTACDVDRSRSFLHSSFVPHRRAIDALDLYMGSSVRRVRRNPHPLRYGEAWYPATTPVDLAPIPETNGITVADRERRRPRRPDQPARAGFPGSIDEFQPRRWTAHSIPSGVFHTSTPQRVLQNHNQCEFTIKPNFSYFNGDSCVEDYLDWEQEVDNFFYYACVPQERQVRSVVRKLEGRAAAWWSHLTQARRHEGRSDVKTWSKMKRLLREQFLSSQYETLLEQQSREYSQEFRSVKVFTKSETSQLRRQRGNPTWSSEVLGSFSCEIKPSEVLQVVEKKDVDLPIVTDEKIFYNSAEEHMLKSNWPGFESAMVYIHSGNLACLKELSPVEFGDAHAEKIGEINSAMIVEQFDSKTLTTGDELSITVTKGKQLIQHCDSQNQLLVDQTTELNKRVQEVQHKTKVWEALEANKTKEVNRVLITHSSERDEKLWGFGEQLSYKEFEEKKAELVSSKRMLTELSRNIGYAKELVPSEWRETSRPYYYKRFNNLRLKLKKKGSLLLSFPPKPGGIIQDIDNIACSYGERPDNVILAISLVNQDITTFNASESTTEVDPSYERKFRVAWGYVLDILCNEVQSGMNLYCRNGGQLKFLNFWKRAILHQQNSCFEIEGSERQCLQIEGSNSLFFYKNVCECPDNEFLEAFKKPFAAISVDLICREGKPEAVVDCTLDRKVFRWWFEIDNPWTNDDETDDAEMIYVNLQLNPERYTGYVGPSARRIWDAMLKLISGLHASISVLIASDYLFDEAINMWGQNLELLYGGVLRYSELVRNLYFIFLFVLRVTTKAAYYLEQAEYNTGNLEENLLKKIELLSRFAVEQSSTVTELEQNFSRHLRAILNPLIAIFGIIVSQEGVIACSEKFHPLFIVVAYKRGWQFPFPPKPGWCVFCRTPDL